MAKDKKVFVWMDEDGAIQVSIAHRTKEELVEAYSLGSDVLVLREFPFGFAETEKSEEILGRYYRVLEGLLELPEMETIVELLMTEVARECLPPRRTSEKNQSVN